MIENEHGEVQLWEKPIARVPIEAQNYEENKTPHHQCSLVPARRHHSLGWISTSYGSSFGSAGDG